MSLFFNKLMIMLYWERCVFESHYSVINADWSQCICWERDKCTRLLWLNICMTEKSHFYSSKLSNLTTGKRHQRVEIVPLRPRSSSSHLIFPFLTSRITFPNSLPFFLLLRSPQTFSIKGQRIHILGSVGHTNFFCNHSILPNCVPKQS